MDIKPIDQNDLRSLRKHAKGLGRKASGHTVKSRREAEKPRRSALDGRSQRATGRSAQLNTTVRPEIKALVAEARPRWGMPICTFIENAIEQYARQLEIEEAG